VGDDGTVVRFTSGDDFGGLMLFFTFLTAATVGVVDFAGRLDWFVEALDLRAVFTPVVAFDETLPTDFVFRTVVRLFKVADLVVVFFGTVFDFLSLFVMILT